MSFRHFLSTASLKNIIIVLKRDYFSPSKSGQGYIPRGKQTNTSQASSKPGGGPKGHGHGGR
ncbi:hypothetical protein ARMGADRAFT_1004973 [Armillaria gallica]|uniref:Uncharacterized protein n=1 Tax=Armillaria gallica TaxID=47427 RepID=A0A2H3EEH7_ARMGA|nr:hypothetical protein ARMGADRAFT_1004973 [Armillaria gallica]